MSNTCIDDLVDEWCGVIVFGTSFVEIQKISADTYCALFFHDGNRVGNPQCIGDGVDKPSFVKLINFLLYFFYLRWVQLMLFLVYWRYVRPSVNMVLYYSRTKPRNF